MKVTYNKWKKGVSMENISILAKKIFEEIPENTWPRKNLMEIESELQKIMNEMG